MSRSDSELLALIQQAAQTTQPISLGDVPEFLRERFTTKSGEIGQVVIIFPSISLSHGKRSMAFADDVAAIRTADGRTHYAASTAIVASDMLRLMIGESPRMVALTILLVLFFKWIILRRPKWILIAFLPLAASFIWMFGLMALFGLKLNFYNLVVLPTLLGIGDDSGIHVVHRYIEEGRGSIRHVLRSTGEHITVSAFTTMVGFGGLLFSMYEGLRSIGELAILGVATTLLAALFLVPALLQWLEDREAKVHSEALPSPT